jgi:MFS family permease
LMGVEPTFLIGNLVGVAINQISRSRPGGAPPAPPDLHLTNSQRAQKNLEAYCAYVTKIGHPEAAAQARADHQTWQQIQRVTSKIEGNYLGNSMANLIHAGIAFYADVTLLPNVVIVFVLGLIAARLGRLPRIQRRKPLPAGIATGFWSVVLIGILLTALYLSDPGGSFELFAALIVLVPLAFVALVALFEPRFRRRLAVGVTAAALTLAVAGLLGLAASWQAVILGWLALCFAIPLLLIFLWSIAALVKHVPFSVKIVENFRAIMPPLVCALMLVYGGLTLWTVQQEARANYGLERSLHGEGQYLAQMTGQAWPGPVQ